jgi:O-antigen/teichoic acid export membrane protein
MTRSASSGKRNLVTNAAANWLGYALQVVVAFFLSPILVKALGLERYGIWQLVDSILAYLVLLDFGIGASVVRFVAKFEATHDYEKVNRVFSTSISIFTAAGLLAQVLAFGLAYGVLPLFEKIPAEFAFEARWLLILLGLNLALGLPLKVFGCLLDALGRYPAQNTVRAAGLLFRTGVLLSVVTSGGGLIPLAAAITGCNALESLVIAVLAKRYMPELRFSIRGVDRATLKTIRGYSLDAFLAMIAGRLSFQTNAIVIGAFLPTEQIALYAIAARLLDYAKESFRTMTVGLVPAVSVLEARGDAGGIRRVLIDGTRYVFWLALPVQVGLMILGKTFLSLWMHSDPTIAERSYTTLLILATPLALALPQVIAARILYGIGQLRWFSRAALVEALATFALSLTLVSPLGIEGVALATAVPNIIGTLVLIVYICRTLEVGIGTYFRQSFLAPFAWTAVLAAAWLITVQYVPLTTWPALIFVGGAGMVGYLLVGCLVEFGPRRILELALSARGRRMGKSPEISAVSSLSPGSQQGFGQGGTDGTASRMPEPAELERNGQ